MELYEGHRKERGEISLKPESKENKEDEEMLAARAAFKPHFLVKGDERYKVLLSKFKPYNGYVWINNKAVKEEVLLKKGSEYAVVIIPATMGHYIMLMRNLLYTAITRAKARCIIVGEKKAVMTMVHTNTVRKRNTALAEKISEFDF